MIADSYAAARRALSDLIASQQPIMRMHGRWLATGEVDLDELATAHARATVAAHRHYCAAIPAYRTLADGLGLVSADDPDVIRAELMSTDDLFKSYDPLSIERRDFGALTRWLSAISTIDLAPDRGARTVERWLAALRERGIAVRYSSASSGRLSFVPRDRAAQALQARMSSLQLHAASRQYGCSLGELDAYLLCFRGGSQAFAALGIELAGLARSATFLYDFPLDADLLLAVSGARATVTEDAVRRFRAATVDELPERYRRVLDGIAASARHGVPVLVYGAPFQVQALCATLEERNERIALPERSILYLAGGWKSFESERVARDALVARACERFGLAPERAMESYGMTECSVRSTRCVHGRFHVPPAIWPLTLDGALMPQAPPARGRFGFADPFATCFPGLYISGDEVELTPEPCACGQRGLSIVGEVSRARGQEVRGCGGVMASIAA